MDLPNYDNQHLIFGLIFMLSNKLQTIGDNFFEDVTTKQWFILTLLQIMNGHEPTLKELSDAAGSSHQNVKQLVLKLEQKGYLILKKDNEDSRRLRIAMTPKCEEFRQIYSRKSKQFIDKMFTSLNKNHLDTTLSSLLIIKDNLEEMGYDDVKE